MRSSYAARVLLGLVVAVFWSPGSTWAQGRVELEKEIEFGGLFSSMDPSTSATEGIRGWSYGLRVGGAIGNGTLVGSAEIAALFFPQDGGGESPGYKTSGYLGSAAAGLRAPRIRVGSYQVLAGTYLGATSVRASRMRRGWYGGRNVPLLQAAEAVPQPQIHGGFFLEPVIQIEGSDVGAAIRFRLYDPASSLQRVLMVSWYVPIRDPVIHRKGRSGRPRR